MTPDAFADIKFDTAKAKITGATVSSAPKVYFNLVDASGNPITGMTTNNLLFAIAKLVPGTPGSSSLPQSVQRWVSYMVINPATGALGKPGTDSGGKLTDNGDGSYVYEFAQDLATVKARVDAATATASQNKADLDDLTYDANLTHRVGIQLSGAKPGFGTDSSVTGVIKNPIDLIFDFVPATSTEVAQTETDGTKQRNIVDIRNCFTCHVKFTFHGRRSPTTGQGTIDATFGIGGGRQDTRFCVLCHSDQRKFGVANAAITGTTIAAGDRMKDFSMKNLPVWIHKIHMGEHLVLQGYNASNVMLNHIKFPQDVRNCTKCHSDNDGATGGNTVAQADNWKNKPSRLACGACHDGIDFATGTGTSVKGGATGHMGGAHQTDDNCALCHSPGVIATQHTPVLTLTNATTGVQTHFAAVESNLPTGAKKVAYDLNSVTLNTDRNPVFKFKILLDGTAAALSTTTGLPTSGNYSGNGPTFYIAYAQDQDGITAKNDWNVTSTSGQALATIAAAGGLTGPDANGYFTATYVPTTNATTGVVTAAPAVPAGAKKVTGLMIDGFSQTDVAGYTAIKVVPDAVLKPVSANDARRTITSKERCNRCHEKLGVFTTANFHGGVRNNPQVCAFCHDNKTRSTNAGWSASSNYFYHAIHAAGKRTEDFTRNPTFNFQDIGYPGLLRECRQCHEPNTVNFGAAASKAAAESGLLFPVVASGTIHATNPISPYLAQVGVARGDNLGTATSGTALLNSPILHACFACHDTTAAISHMKANGGDFYEARSVIDAKDGNADGTLTSREQCLVCHGAGKIVDVEVMHRSPAGLTTADRVTP
ncbi:MAG: hypothetical protein A3F73_14320 [Gallionellales bacterium RIFCSPLOWO2_12_FULL_59_22]|nr:MAG: hypothetical protein A3H99_06995 [Gallionellales bacterium RIFCSPLOWO2_02_FULL_59_110]OGT05601.1 MAG: hypothetical protein A2Z65_04205 [Gallionellales bacterium RIFCSPLOWO2_02_58_13]OGT14730.1 MAG: hypothetical protein A3F73_14320 [Gallionellales bacterium RIFCSPLOWO2_12_FULL_59_22]